MRLSQNRCCSSLRGAPMVRLRPGWNGRVLCLLADPSPREDQDPDDVTTVQTIRAERQVPPNGGGRPSRAAMPGPKHLRLPPRDRVRRRRSSVSRRSSRTPGWDRAGLASSSFSKVAFRSMARSCGNSARGSMPAPVESWSMGSQSSSSRWFITRSTSPRAMSQRTWIPPAVLVSWISCRRLPSVSTPSAASTKTAPGSSS
jgi:hypothetical protein